MNHLASLFSVQVKILRNSYWRTRRQRSTTMLLVGASLLATVGAAQLLRRYVLAEFLDPAWFVNPAFGWVIFSLVAAFVFLATLTQSMVYLIPKFYRSADLNYLLALPIPPNQVLTIRFLAAQLQSSLSVLFLSLVMLMAIGFSIGAPWYYYAALLPIFWVFTLIPAGIGLLIGMMLLRVMTVKAFTRLAGVLSLGTIGSWFAFVGLPPERLMPLFTRGLELFGWLRHLPADLISLVSAGRLLTALAIGEPLQGLRPLLMLILVTGAAMLLIFWSARHLFYQGWLVTQSAPSTQPRKASRPEAARRTKVYRPWVVVLLMEWRRAGRNEEMRVPWLVTVGSYVAVVLFLIDGAWFQRLGGSPELGLMVLVLGAAVLLPMGMGALFLSLEQLGGARSSEEAITLVKRGMSLMKALPLSTTEVVLVSVLKVTALPFLLGAGGILVYAPLAEVGFVSTLLAVIGLALLLVGSSVSTTGQEFWVYARVKRINLLVAQLLGLLVPAAYFTAAAGPLTLYLLGAIPSLASFRLEPLLVGGLVSWPAVSLLAIWGGWKLARRSWQEMDIE